MRKQKCWRATEGAVLVVTLWITAFLAFLALTLMSRSQLSVRRELWAQVELEERELLSSGARLALERLCSDEDNEVVSYAKPWGRRLRFTSATMLDSGGTLPGFKHPFELSVIPQDEGGKLNINLTSPSILTEVLLEAGVSTNASEIATAINDWRDADDSGAYESDFYARKTPAYSPANASLKRIEELLFVEGVTSQLFFGEDANHNGLLDPNEDDGDIYLPVDNQDGRLQLGLIDMLTVYGDGALNVNTMPEPLLSTVLSVAHLGEGDPRAIAGEILARRRGADKLDGTEDDRPFADITELTTYLSEAQLTSLALADIELGLTSSAFRFYTQVTILNPNSQAEGELVVFRESGELELVEWRDTQF